LYGNGKDEWAWVGSRKSVQVADLGGEDGFSFGFRCFGAIDKDGTLAVRVCKKTAGDEED